MKIIDFSLKLFAVSFIILICLHFFTGYADNGDFARIIADFFYKPEGLSGMWPEVGSDDYVKRYFHNWHDLWLYKNTVNVWGGVNTWSSYKVYLFFQIIFEKTLTVGSSSYSVIVGSIFSRFLLIVFLLVFFFQIKRKNSFIVTLIFLIFFYPVFFQSNWIGFLNSFYQEQVAIIFTPLLLVFLFNYMRLRNIKYMALVFFCTLFISMSKVAYFYFPIIVLLVILPFYKNKKVVFSWFLVVQVLSCYPMITSNNINANSYHSLYYGVFTLLDKEEIKDVEKIIDKDIVLDCIGVNGFGDCLDRVEASHLDFLKIILNRPDVGLEVISRALNYGKTINLDYLGKNLYGSNGFNDLYIFNVFSKLFSKGFNYIVIALFLLSAFMIVFSRLKLNDFFVIGFFLTLLGCSQYVFSLGDGFYEIYKHLIIANFFLALAFPFLCSGFFINIKSSKVT